MPNYLYLDFDGVLHPTSGADPFCRMPLVEAALAGKRCHIVISSSWRFHHTYRSLIALFPAALRPMVAGTTGEAAVGRWPRYTEILMDVERRRAHGNWRALDDSWIEFPRDCPELFKCDPNFGITKLEADALASWLESE